MSGTGMMWPQPRGCGGWDLITEGARGNGTTDDAAIIQSVFDRANPFDRICFRAGHTFLSNTNLHVDKPLTLSGYGATLKATDLTVHQLELRAPQVRVEGLHMVGATGDTLQGSGGTAIWMVAPSWQDALERTTLVDLDIEQQPFAGVWVKYHRERLQLVRVHTQDIAYAAQLGQSVWGVHAEGGSAKRVMGNGSIAYGVAFTRATVTSEATDPKSRDVFVGDYDVEDIPWEGIETHGGGGMRIIGNRVRRCLIGIAGVPAPRSDLEDVFSPQDMQIIGNRIDGEVQDGSLQAGIKVVGAEHPDAGPELYATGGIIEANVIRRMGSSWTSDPATNDDPSVVTGGILAYWTRGLIIAKNQIIEPNHFGITLWNNNEGTVVDGNVVIDPWSDITTACAVAVRATGNSWSLSNNRLINTTGKTAPSVAAIGQRIWNAGNRWVNGGGNDFTAAPTPYQGIAPDPAAG